MIWSGTVLRNNKFGENGTIDVLLSQKFVGNGTSRLWAKPFHLLGNNVKKALAIGTTSFGAGSSLTCKCLVLSSCMGSGSNTGMFAVPQVGTRGIVLEIEDEERFGGVFYIWIGGIYGDKQYGANVTAPRDDTDDDIEDEDAALVKTEEEDTITDSSYIRKGAFIIKTKTNDVQDYEEIDTESVNLENILPENTFVLDKEKASLKHHLNRDGKNIGFEKLMLNENEAYFIRKIKTDEKVLEQKLLMNNDETTLVLTNEDNDVENIIKFKSDGGIEIGTTGEMTITAKKDMNIKSDKNMSIEAGGKMDLISDGKMNIHGANKNLLDLIDRLAYIIETFKTQGSPAAQFVMPDEATNIATIRSELKANFDNLG